MIIKNIQVITKYPIYFKSNLTIYLLNALKMQNNTFYKFIFILIFCRYSNKNYMFFKITYRYI